MTDHIEHLYYMDDKSPTFNAKPNRISPGWPIEPLRDLYNLTRDLETDIARDTAGTRPRWYPLSTSLGAFVTADRTRFLRASSASSKEAL